MTGPALSLSLVCSWIEALLLFTMRRNTQTPASDEYLNTDGFVRVTMATRVEVSPLTSLTPVPNLNEIEKEDKLQTTYYHPVSKTPVSPPVMVLDGRRNLGTPSRPLPTPRVSPKPFSKESPSDSFANVKSPITSVKPGAVMTRPLVYSKLEDLSTAKALDENMPSLVEPELDDGGNLNSNGTPCNKTLPQNTHSQNTIILFETAGPAKSKANPSLGKWRGEEQKSQVQGQLPSSKNETMTKPALPPRKPVGTLQRQASLSSDGKLTTLKSWEKREENEPLASPGTKNEGGCPSSEVQLRVKRRPVSAIFESLQHSKPSPLETSGGKMPPTPPEKPWVRKPRPLSVDLTARFENKDILSKKVGSLVEESKEKRLGLGASDKGHGEERSEPLDRTSCSKSSLRLKEWGPDAPALKNKVKEQNQKIVCKSIDSSSLERSMDQAEALVRKGRSPLEETARQERDMDSKEAEGSGPLLRSEKSPQLGDGNNRTAEGNGRVTERDGSGGQEWAGRGSVKKRVSQFGSESFSSWSSTEAPVPAPEQEKGSVKVQARIKEWTVESPEVPLENKRRSFQSRPLSADLTKLFTRPALEVESRLEKGPSSSGELLQEGMLQEKNKEGHVSLGTDLSGASAVRNQWKPVEPWEKSRQTERKLSSSNETDSPVFPKEDSNVAPHRPEAQSPSRMAEDDGDFQTVWATVFEHNVVKRTVADHPLLTSSGESTRRCSEGGTEKGSWLGKTQGDKDDQMNVRNETSKWAERLITEKPRSRVVLDEEKEKHSRVKRWNVSPVKQTGNNLTYQRIEPRYDILHTMGEKTLSEAVLTAPEEKALPLRTGRQWSSMKEKQSARSEGLNSKQQGRLSIKMGPSQARERLETTAPKSEFPELKDVSGTNLLPPNRMVEKPYLVNQDKVSGVGGGEKASRFSHQNAKEKESTAHVPEPVVVRAAHIDPYNLYSGVSLVEANKLGSQSSVEERSHPHSYFNSPHSRVELRPIAKEESPDFRSRKHFGLRSMRKEPLVVDEEGESSQSQAPEPEAKVRKSGSADVRITERWRRRTLPHDVKFDEFISFVPEPSKGLGRQVDSLSPSDAYFKKSRQTQDGPDLKEANWGVPQNGKDVVPKPEPSQEARETYFAVTYHIPGDHKECSPDNSVYENRRTSLGGKDEPTSAHHPRKLSFLSESSPNSRLAPPYPRDPSGNAERKNWTAKEKEQENLSFCKNPRPTDQAVLPGERWVRNADDRVIDVDTLCVNQRSGNVGTPSDLKEDGGNKPSRPLEHFMSKNGDIPTRRKQSVVHEAPRAKVNDGYKSSVLDIDALMVEYKGESMKTSDHKDRKEERVLGSHGGFHWEKPGTKSSADHFSQRYDWRDQKEPQDHTGFRKSVNIPGQQPPHRPEESSPMLHSGPEISKEKSEVPALEWSKQKAPSAKYTPPLWAMPQSGLPEQYLDSPSDTWKRILAPEDEKKDAVPAHKPQSTKCWSYRAEANTPSHEKKHMEGNSPPKTSPNAQDGILFEDEVWAPRNSVGKREKAGSLHGRAKVRRGEYVSDFGSTPADLKRTYSEKTAPTAVREGLSLMQEARERRKEQAKTRESLPGENLESEATSWEFPQWERMSSEDQKVPQDFEKEKVRSVNKSSLRDFSPMSAPRRSHSFCKDKKKDPFMDQLKQCFARQPPEAKDTDTLVQENDSQYGTWNDPRQSGESFAPESPSPDNNVASVRKQPPGSRLSSLSSQTEPASPAELGDSSRDQRSTSVDCSSTDLDSTDGTEGPPADAGPEGKVDDFSFLNQTSVLDSSALKARAQLSKRNRRRAPISHFVRRSRASEVENWSSLVEEDGSAWMFKDSTEDKSVKKEESDEEEKPYRSERTPTSQPQRLPIFPGLDPSVLKAQLRKRHESDGSSEVPASAQVAKSPKSPFQPGVLGSRVLPSSVEKEERSEETSPQWLKDLKSKKRQSQYENQA